MLELPERTWNGLTILDAFCCAQLIGDHLADYLTRTKSAQRSTTPPDAEGGRLSA